jgi:OOP family OmpA-OmpF porin
MKKNLISMAVTAVLGLVAFTASADDMYRGAWYAVPGINLMQDDGSADKDRFGAGAFIKLGKELSTNWDVQGGLSYTNSGLYKQTTLGLDALYMFSRDKFRPFLLAGVGVARNKLDYKLLGSPHSETSPMVNLGLGAQYLLTDTFGLQADLREVWSRAEDKDVNPNNSFDRQTINNTVLNLGGIFRFGAPAPMPVAAATPEPTPAPYVAPAPEPTPAPYVAPAPVACTPIFETVTVSADQLFGFNKYKLSNDGKAALDDVVTKLKAHPEFELVMVTGHADRIGSVAYNQKLSERRANAVKQYLVAQGVEDSRLQAVGKGKSEPVAECKGAKSKKLIECLAPNRRVVISDQKQHDAGCK